MLQHGRPDKDYWADKDRSYQKRDCENDEYDAYSAQNVCADEEAAMNDKPEGTKGNPVPMYWWFRYEHV
jgi:hypothetical protein